MTFLFIEKFKWTNLEHTVIYEGHPKEGRVYKSFYNQNDNTYTIGLTENRAVMIQELNADSSDFSYSSKIHTLTKENLLDFNIEDEDLDKIINWMEPQEQPINNLVIAMQRQEIDEKQFLQNFINKVSQLYNINTIQAEVLMDVVEALYDNNLYQVNDTVSRLELDRDRGLSVNICRAFRALDNYSGEDRRTSEDYEDLMTAIVSTVREAERRIVNDLDR